MNIIVIGSGGREHAIIKKLRESKEIDKIYALPGNGGMTEAECVSIGANDITAVVDFAKNHDIGFAVVAPDDPLVLGMVDELEKVGIPCFGPEKKAAIIEGSKVFSKNLMKKYGIPTAAYETFGTAEEAREYIKTAPMPIVIKADGLALGKGVLICKTRDDRSLRGAVENTKEGREGMALGQYIAGMGFSNVGLGIAHSMAHTLGAVYDTPHGVACAMMLPIVMEYNQECTGEKYREIARAMGVKGVDNMTQEEYRKAAIDAVKKLSADVGIPSVLESVKEDDLQFLAESAHADACAPGNPKDASVEDLKDLFRKIMK